MALAFGPGKPKSESFLWSRSGCASRRARVCTQNGLTPARRLLGLLRQERRGTDGYARKGALLLGPASPKTALSPGKSLLPAFGAA